MIHLKRFNKKLKYLEPVGMFFRFPKYNSSGREVGHYNVPIEDLALGFRRSVYEILDKMRQYRAQGRDDLAGKHCFALRQSLTQYKKYWKIYLEAL